MRVAQVVSMKGRSRYQIYFLARDGEILRTFEFDCAGDQEAVQKAIHVRGADEVEIEVWDRTRFVGWLPMPPLQCSHRKRAIAGSFDRIRSHSSDGILKERAVFDLSLFRFRSQERDRETDERRLAQIWKVVRSAVAGAEAESKGLRVRIAKARRSGIFLVDQVDGGDLDPNERASFTSDLLTAEQRLVQLNDHLAFLRDIEMAATRPTAHVCSWAL
jgi:hypothetical protein